MTTLFLASIWGPIILAVGIGVFFNRSYYARLYRDLQRETLAVLTFGMVMMGLGIWQIGAHNSWDTFAEGLISFLGWGLLAKGLAFIIAPTWVDQSGDWTADSKLLPLVGTLTTIVGAYLTYIAYLA